MASASSRKWSGLATFHGGLATARAASACGKANRHASARRSASSAGYLTTFVLGSVAQGAPFVLVAAALERRDVGAGWLTAIAAVRLAPYLLCSPIAGALAGRYASRTVFAATGLGRAALIVVLWAALGMGAPPAVLVSLLFVLVAVGTPTYPALMWAVHQTVPPARLDRASALAAGLESAAFWAGPALGGLLLVVATDTGSWLVCAALMAVAAGFASTFPSNAATTRPNGSRSNRPVRNAGRCLLGSGVSVAIVAVLAVNMLAGLNAALLVRLPAGLDLGGERTFGLLSFVHGAGAFGAFVLLLRPIHRGHRPLVPLAAAGAAVGMLAATSELYIALAASCVLGASILTADVLVTSALGRSLPGPLVAPAFGVLDALVVAAIIVGAVVAPVLEASFGLRPTLAVAGVGTPLVAISSLRFRRDRAWS